MAKKKEEKLESGSTKISLAERKKNLAKLIEGINQQSKEVVCGFIDDPDIQKQINLEFIRTPNDNLNEAIGGGFPKGRLSIVTGLSDSGKTSLMLETVGLAMKESDDFVALWLESEQSLNYDYMINQFHIDPSRFLFIKMTESGGEEALDKCIAILKSKMVDMFVINSMRALVPKTEMNKSISEDTVATQARMNTKALKQIMSASYAGNIATVVIQHLSTLIGSMSRDPYAMGGGLLLKYGGLLMLDMRKQTVLDTDPINKEEGMKVMISVKKNHVTPRLYPYVKVPHFVIYGEGTEQILTALDQALKQGVLRQTGAWIYWDEKDLKWCGKQAFRQSMKENPDTLQTLKNYIHGDIEVLSEEEMKELHINPEEDKKEMQFVEKQITEEDE